MQIISVKKTVHHVDKLSLYYLLHPVVHKHDSNNLCYPLFQPLRLSILPFPYAPSPPPYLFPDLSSFLCLKCTLFLSAILIRL